MENQVVVVTVVGPEELIVVAVCPMEDATRLATEWLGEEANKGYRDCTFSYQEVSMRRLEVLGTPQHLCYAKDLLQ